ncbi:carbamoyl-phosphate synthase small subunit [Lederbergia galactosidilyticus]|uniref:carbamoyl phosphate synthase small subunit n=1 Tax=Lederbergia galactosidilytica TaxID=217031 RepID=UPI001AE8682F|nr:carbamoyl phosphate synthase small subunit [Lederbergia galactosidilytica]MBP1913525.1 carbamoyl-phosphate synthase small subunit [Lederbergia galactosidilytica]
MKGIIQLANKKQYTGLWHGDVTHCKGEIIFYTGMGNFLEFMTDPETKGKIVVATYPGVLHSHFDPAKFESEDLQLSALITQQEILVHSDVEESWLSFFNERGIPIMSSMDTRTIIKELLKDGEMSAELTAEDHKLDSQADCQKTKSEEKPIVLNANEKNNLVVLNFGIKKSLLNWLKSFHCKLTILPAGTTASAITEIAPDGVIFSGGSGHPGEYQQYFEDYAKVAKSYPTMAFGLGHQILALAFGGNIEKMKWGHRGCKHAIYHTSSKQVYLTNQNHGYHISLQDLEETGFKPSFLSVQDGDVEGLIHQDFPITTYQFHPDGTNYKLESFIKTAYFKQLEQSKGEKLYAEAK